MQRNIFKLYILLTELSRLLCYKMVYVTAKLLLPNQNFYSENICVRATANTPCQSVNMRRIELWFLDNKVLLIIFIFNSNSIKI